MQFRRVVSGLVAVGVGLGGVVVSAAPASAAETYHLVNSSGEALTPLLFEGPVVGPGAVGTFGASSDGVVYFDGGFGVGSDGQPLRAKIHVYPNWLTGGTAVCTIVNASGARVHPEDVDCVANKNVITVGKPKVWKVDTVVEKPTLAGNVSYVAHRPHADQQGVIWSEDINTFNEPGYYGHFATIEGAEATAQFWPNGGTARETLSLHRDGSVETSWGQHSHVEGNTIIIRSLRHPNDDDWGNWG